MTSRPWISLFAGALLAAWITPNAASAQPAKGKPAAPVVQQRAQKASPDQRAHRATGAHTRARAAESTLRELGAVRRFLHTELQSARAKDDTRRALHLKARLRQVDAAIESAEQRRARARSATRQSPGSPFAGDYTIVTLRRGVETDPAAQGAAMIQSMAATRKRLARQLRHAQHRRDVALSACLYRPLRQVNANLATARGRLHTLGSATARGERDLADHEITILSVLQQRVAQARAQARGCTSVAEIGTPGELSVRTTIDRRSPRR